MANPPEQLSLPRPLMKLDDTVIRAPKNLLRAFIAAAELGGLEDKQAAAAAGMDPATWSQFKAGDRGIKPLALSGYMDQCANELPLAHWAFSRGYMLVPLESELERRLRIEREGREKVEAENKLLREILSKR
jgi:hypothetical protein